MIRLQYAYGCDVVDCKTSQAGVLYLIAANATEVPSPRLPREWRIAGLKLICPRHPIPTVKLVPDDGRAPDQALRDLAAAVAAEEAELRAAGIDPHTPRARLPKKNGGPPPIVRPRERRRLRRALDDAPPSAPAP